MSRINVIGAAMAALVAAEGSSAEVRVMVRGHDTIERQVGSLHASGASITITTEQLAQAARTVGNPWYNYQFVRIYDTNSENGGTPTDDIGPVEIVGNSTLPPQIRVLVAPPLVNGENGQEDFAFTTRRIHALSRC